MKLSKIFINNYRSIVELPIEIKEIANKKCHILLGINEAGKSTILKAVSLLDNGVGVNYQIDCNKKAQNDNEEIVVICDLELNDEELKIILKNTQLPAEIKEKILLDELYRFVTIDKDNKRQDYYDIHIKDIILSDYVLEIDTKQIKKIKDLYQGEEKITEQNIKTLLTDKYSLLKKIDIENVLQSSCYKELEELRPKVILWQSQDAKYLINDYIDLNNFKNDQNISIPLRNIFRLSGIQDDQIKNRIDQITDNEDKRAELEEILTDKVTKYINKVWPELRINIKIRIELNLLCSVKVEDKKNTKPKFKMNQRSDGFKQFISILLNLSAENETKNLVNKIVLLDEPEVHLHPSGIKYLRDELLKISKSNIVLIATHSIFMIDKKNLERHLSVTKNDDSITNIDTISEENPLQEEVVYEALGTSIYEIIKENIIVFEGKSDKEYFEFFTAKFRSELKPLEFHTIPASGADKVKNYIKFLKDGLIKGYAVLDSDNAGLDAKRNIIELEESFRDKVFCINDIYNLSIKATLEDLLPKEIILKYFKERYELYIEYDPSIPIVEQLKKSLKSSGKYISDEQFDEFKKELHKSIIEDLTTRKYTKDKIKEDFEKYFLYISKLHEKIKQQ